MVTLLVSLQPKNTALWLSPSETNVSTEGMNGMRVRLWLKDCTYVVRISEPLGKLLLVSAELSLTMMAEILRAGCRKGKMGLFCKASPPSTKLKEFCAWTSFAGFKTPVEEL